MFSIATLEQTWNIPSQNKDALAGRYCNLSILYIKVWGTDKNRWEKKQIDNLLHSEAFRLDKLSGLLLSLALKVNDEIVKPTNSKKLLGGHHLSG